MIKAARIVKDLITPTAIGVIAFCASFFLRSEDFNGNLTQMVASIRDGFLDINPNHILFQPSLYWARSLFPKADIFILGQALTSIYAGAISIGIFYLMLALSRAQLASTLIALIFSFSYSIWWYGAMGYPVLLGFAPVPLYLAAAVRLAEAPNWKRWLVLVVLNVLLPLAYISNIFVQAAVFFFLMLSLQSWRGRLKATTIFAASAVLALAAFYAFYLSDGQRPAGISFPSWMTSYGGGTIYLDFGGFGHPANYYRFVYQLANVFWHLSDLGKMVKFFISNRNTSIFGLANLLSAAALAAFYLLLAVAAVWGARQWKAMEGRIRHVLITLFFYLSVNVFFNFYWVIDTQIMIPVIFATFTMTAIIVWHRRMKHEATFWASLLAFTAVWNLANGIYPDHINRSGRENISQLNQMAEPGATIITPGGDWVRSFGIYFLEGKRLITLYHLVAGHPLDETKEEFFKKLEMSIDGQLAKGLPVYLSGVKRPNTVLATAIQSEPYIWGDISMRGYSRDDFIEFFDHYAQSPAFVIGGLEFYKLGPRQRR